MKKWNRPSFGLALAITACAPLSFGADPPAPAPAAVPVLVGDLGRPDALRFEGNETFTKDQILDGLTWQMDYHVASHPAAPLDRYAARLERQITLGYQHAGFPEVTVHAVPNPAGRRLAVRINEGRRYRCGDIHLSGVPSMTNEVVRQKIADIIAGLEPGAAQTQTNLSHAVWSRNEPVPFDEASRRHLLALVEEALAGLDYFHPKASLRIAPDPARGLADLQIEFTDEGVKGAIEQIEVTGIRASNSPQVMEYLGLKPGMELHASLLNTISNRLWDSARFLHQDVRLHPLDSPGKFKLELDLEELREAPPLNRDFSPQEKALLKFRQWLMDWDKHPENLVCAVHATSSWIQVHADLTLSPSGLALVARTGSSRDSPKLGYALVASTTKVGLYSAWRRSQYAFTRDGGQIRASLQFVPTSHPGAGNKWNFLVAGGFTSNGDQPLFVDMILAPVAFLGLAHDDQFVFSLANGRLTYGTTNVEEKTRLNLQVDAATGRLIQFEAESNAGTVRLFAQESAFAHRIQEIAAATADHPNQYVPGHGVSSWFSFAVTELIESPLVEPLLSALFGEGTSTNPPPEVLAMLNRLKPFLAQSRALLREKNLQSVFEPLDRLFHPPSGPDEKKEEVFFVPLEDSPDNAQANPMVVTACAAVLKYSDAFLTRDSWPWTLARQTAFAWAGHGEFAQAELDQLLRSEDVGPVACLVAAHLLGQRNPPLARLFAERGLSRLTVAQFQKDYRALLLGDSIVSRIADNLLRLFESLRVDEMASLTASVSPEERAFLQQGASLIRAAKDQAPGAAAWPAWEKHWDRVVRPHVESALNRFLPQVQFLTDPQALYERGLALVSSKNIVQDFEEAAQCFRKAADQGHAEAQLSLGILYEQGRGLPEDPVEAMRWYQKAAAQHVPHAGCRVGDLYRDGKGVVKDLDEAAQWYRKEAEGTCAGAQFNLGLIFEKQRHLPGAMTWYRRAAAGGVVQAQARLADLLTDGFSVNPDYLEACQWLLLAVENAENDRLLEVELRRVKAKLTSEQLEEAMKRAGAIRQRLEDKDSKTGPAK
jgi:TPR repeat protein